jgi:hypothetical protein
MGDMSIQLLEVGTHGFLDHGRKMMALVGGMEDLIAFLEERSKGSTAHLKPPITLLFVVSCSEHACFQNDLLIVVIFNSWGSLGEEVFIVDHLGVLVGEYFWPVNGASVHGSTGFKFHR